jgi:hypothetical protein
MKKILSFLIIILLQSNVAKAEIFDLYQCFSSGQLVGDDGNRIERSEVTWTNANQERYNKLLTIEGSQYIDFLEWKLQKDKKNLKDPYILQGYKHQIDKAKETLKKKKELKLSTFAWVSPFRYTNEEYKKLLTYNPKVSNYFEKKAYTINTDANEIVELIVYSQEAIYKLSTGGMYLYKTAKNDKEKNSALEYRRGIEKRKIKKYTIDEYAGGLLIGSRKDFPKYKIVIDINTLEVETSYNNMGSNYQLCNSSFQTASGESGPSSGTAFFVSKKGHLITNQHVVEGCKLSKVIYRDEEYDTKLISVDKNLDLALLKANLKPTSFIKFSNKPPKKRQQIIVAGYPLGQGLSDDLKINDGRISSVKGFENNTNQITVDIAINPGNSGGPIVSEKGELIAVAVSGLSKDVTEGLNFGIKASAVKDFLEINDVKTNNSFKFSFSDEDIVNLLEETTVYTYCD